METPIDVVNHLVNRDGMLPEDAWDLVEECQLAIEELSMAGAEGIDGAPLSEDILEEYLGLDINALPAIM